MLRAALAMTSVMLLGGCDLLFNLDHVPPDAGASEAGIDATVADGSGDASRCDVTADEDTDGLPDPCDPCPTVSIADPADGDGDGLPNVCDPNLGVNMRDKIEYSAMFSDGSELTQQFTASGDTYIPGNHGQVLITAGGVVKTNSPHAPTMVEVRVASPTGTTNTALIRVGIGTLSCEITGADCGSDTNTSQICTRLKSGTVYGSGATSNFPMGTITSVAMLKAAVGSSTILCQPMASGLVGVQAMMTTAFPQATVSIQPGNQTIYVNSLVVYGTQ